MIEQYLSNTNEITTVLILPKILELNKAQRKNDNQRQTDNQQEIPDLLCHCHPCNRDGDAAFFLGKMEMPPNRTSSACGWPERLDYGQGSTRHYIISRIVE